MPTYLCHGFRWQRRSIRVYVVVQNLDDAAPEWTIKQGSARNLIESFYNLFDFLPECTFPPTRSSSRAPLSRSVSHSVSQTSMARAAYKDDDDDASHHTNRSSQSMRRSPSRSGSTATLQQQSSLTEDRTVTTPDKQRPSSNSSRKRSEAAAGPSNVHALSSRSTALTYQGHHAPPSPPSSQPGFNFAFQSSEPADPVLAQSWSPIKLLEEYDPANLEEVSRPYAYVADYVTRINDSCSIVEEIQRYEAHVRRESIPPVTGASSDDMLNGKRDTSKLGRRAGWFEKLRDQLQRGEDIRWYVVVVGDAERAWPGDEARGGSRSSLEHHKQYTHQQTLFEAQDRELELKRQQLRKELGYEHGGVDRLMDRRLERRPKPQQKELPPLRTKASIMNQIVSASPRTSKSPRSPKTPKSPKSPGRASLRKLFSRGKAEEQTAV